MGSEGVLSRRAVAPRAERPIERDAEIALLTEHLRALGQSSGSVVLLEGPAGMGKSTLIGIAAAKAGENGVQVLAAAGRSSERDFPFGVVLQLLEPSLAKAGPAGRKRLLSGAAAQAGPLLGGQPIRSQLAENGRSSLHGLYWLCRNLAQSAPLLLCVDEAHVMDEPSMRFVLHVTQRVQDLPVMVLLATLPVDRDIRPAMLGEIASQPSVTREQLRPLTRQGVARLLGASGGHHENDDMTEACFRATGGNPFLLRELRRALELGPDGEGTPAAVLTDFVPRPITTSALRRMREIHPEASELARAVAVLGDEAPLRHAAALAEMEPAEALSVADRLAEEDFLRRDDRLSFVHPIVRTALYLSVPPCERAEKHAAAARMLAAEDAELERIAGHLLLSPRVGSEWTVQLLAGAAAEALGRGAPGPAVAWVGRALEEPPPPEERRGLLLTLGRAEAAMGDAKAATHLAHARDRVEEPEQRARIALEIGSALALQGKHRRAADMLEHGLAEIGAADPQLRARLESGLTLTSRTARSPGMVPFEVRPVEIAAAGDRPPGGRAALASEALEKALAGTERAEVRALAERALDGGALLDEETADGLVFYVALAALMIAEELQTAELAVAMAMEQARDRGSVLGLATATCFRAWTVMRSGRVQEAGADAATVLAARRQGWGLAVPAVEALMVLALLESGDVHAAERQLEESAGGDAGLDLPSSAYLAARAGLRYAQGRAEQALADYLECGRRLTAVGITNPAVAPWLSGAALASAHTGARSEGISMAEDELRRAESFGAPGAIGRALRARAGLESGSRRVELLEQAVIVLEGSQAVLERARTLVDLGAALRREGHRRDSRRPLLQGLDLAARCGADLIVARAASEITAAGARPRRNALTGVESLTPREREVAALAARGMTNREIAESLYITLKTVEWHLKHSYRKLGATRAELADALSGEGRAPE